MASRASQPLRILMIPARRNRTTNPYNYLLTTALEETGCQVDDFATLRALTKRHDVLHLHWPEHFAENSNLAKAIARSGALLAVIFATKRRKGRVVWTVHDVESLTQRNTLLRAGLMRLVMPAVDTFIFMNQSSRSQFVRKFPELRDKTYATVPHGNFVGVYGATISQREARDRLGITTCGRLIGIIGDRKPYKGTETVLGLATAARQRGVALLIAGTTHGAAYAAELDPHIRRAVKDDGAIFIDRRLSDVELATCIQACDAIALPYREGSNSGMGLVALSYRRPLICSRLPVFVDLQDDFGPNWVKVCERDEEYLQALAAAGDLAEADVARLDVRLRNRAWSNVARLTKSAYQPSAELAPDAAAPATNSSLLVD